MKGKPALIANVVRAVATLVLLFFVFKHAHWSVFAVLLLMTIAIETCAAVLGINMREIRAVRQLQKSHRKDFDDFVAALNQQAQSFQIRIKQADDICGECTQHGHMGIRPGAPHNRAAANCLLNPSKS